VPAKVDVLPIKTELGESPLWDAERAALWFIDIRAPALHRLDMASSNVKTWPMPEPIGSLGLCTSGRLLLALKHSLHVFDPRTGAREMFVTLDEEPEHNRLNDGKVAPDGAFWVGSMDADTTQRRVTGALYRIGADGRVERKANGLKISNGLAWSADGRTMFHADSGLQWIKRYRHERGVLSDEQVIAMPTERIGRPDGAATDVEGGYWSAGVSAGCLNRWSRDGELLERVELPVPNPTMPCFAGDDMKTVYVTSLTRTPHEHAGAMVRLRLPVAGVPVAQFPL
jgi:sugar lactone lactonase YvrE